MENKAQEKFYWLEQNIEQLCRYAEKHHEYSEEDTESINLLIKEFRECFENLLKENEELKKVYKCESHYANKLEKEFICNDIDKLEMENKTLKRKLAYRDKTIELMRKEGYEDFVCEYSTKAINEINESENDQ